MTSLKVAALSLSLALAALLAAGCGAAIAPSALETSPTHSAPTRSVLPTATSSTSPDPSTSVTPTSTPTPAPPTTAAPTTGNSRVPMQTATGGEFLSPSGNISCEIDYHRAGLTQAYCQTVTPPRSVTMGATGRYTACTGQQCLGNPGTNTPTVAYGAATGVGPFLCTSASTGITCVAGGKGFRISTSGITPVSA